MILNKKWIVNDWSNILILLCQKNTFFLLSLSKNNWRTKNKIVFFFLYFERILLFEQFYSDLVRRKSRRAKKNVWYDECECCERWVNIVSEWCKTVSNITASFYFVLSTTVFRKTEKENDDMHKCRIEISYLYLSHINQNWTFMFFHTLFFFSKILLLFNLLHSFYIHSFFSIYDLCRILCDEWWITSCAFVAYYQNKLTDKI